MNFLERLDKAINTQVIEEAVSFNDIILIDASNYDPQMSADPYKGENRPPEEEGEETYITITAFSRALSTGLRGDVGASVDVNWEFTQIPGLKQYLDLPYSLRNRIKKAYAAGKDEEQIAAGLSKSLGFKVDTDKIRDIFQLGQIKTPWEHFMRWFGELLQNNGLEPYPERGFGDGEVDFETGENIYGIEVPREVGGKEITRKQSWDYPVFKFERDKETGATVKKTETISGKLAKDDPRGDVRRQLTIITNKLGSDNPDIIDNIIGLMNEDPNKPEWLRVRKIRTFADPEIAARNQYRIAVGVEVEEPGFEEDPEKWNDIRKEIAAKQHELARKRSVKAGETRSKQSADKLTIRFKELYQSILDDAKNFPETSEIDPSRIELALNKYIAELFQIAEFSPEDFDKYPLKDRRRVVKVLSGSDYISIRDLIESYNVWAKAISENDDKLLKYANMLLDNAISDILPLPENEIEEDISELLHIRRRIDYYRNLLNEKPNVYAAYLAMNKYSIDQINTILESQGLERSISDEQLKSAIAGIVLEDISVEEDATLARSVYVGKLMERATQLFKRVLPDLKRDDLWNIERITPQSILNNGELCSEDLNPIIKPFGVSFNYVLGNAPSGKAVRDEYWR